MSRASLMQTFRATFAALVIVLGGTAPPALASTAGMAAAQSGGWGGSACDAIPEESRSLCIALEARMCSLADADDFWTCRALLDANCSLISDAQTYWMCVAVTTSNCTLVSDAGTQSVCRGVVRRDCSGLDQQGFTWCTVMVRSVAVRQG